MTDGVEKKKISRRLHPAATTLRNICRRRYRLRGRAFLLYVYKNGRNRKTQGDGDRLGTQFTYCSGLAIDRSATAFPHPRAKCDRAGFQSLKEVYATLCCLYFRGFLAERPLLEQHRLLRQGLEGVRVDVQLESEIAAFSEPRADAVNRIFRSRDAWKSGPRAYGDDQKGAAHSRTRLRGYTIIYPSFVPCPPPASSSATASTPAFDAARTVHASTKEAGIARRVDGEHGAFPDQM